MNIAICISGQPRLFKTSFLSLKQSLLNKLDNNFIKYDIFISSWNNHLNTNIGKLESVRYLDEGSLDEFVDLYQPVKYEFEEWNGKKELFFQNIQDKYPGFKQDNHAKRWAAMQYKVLKCNELKKQHEIDNGIKYDFTIRTRSDLEYSDNFDINWFNNNCLIIDHYGNGSNYAAPGDCFAIGNSFYIDKYCDMYSNIEHYAQQGIPIHCEVMFEYHFKHQKVNWQKIDFVKNVFRPSTW